MEVLRPGSNWSCSWGLRRHSHHNTGSELPLQPYTTAYRNVRSLTHRATMGTPSLFLYAPLTSGEGASSQTSLVVLVVHLPHSTWHLPFSLLCVAEAGILARPSPSSLPTSFPLGSATGSRSEGRTGRLPAAAEVDPELAGAWAVEIVARWVIPHSSGLGHRRFLWSRHHPRQV